MPMEDKEYYTISEIAAATGIKQGTLRARRTLYGIPSPRSRGVPGHTYEEVLQLQRKPPKSPMRGINEHKVDRLKLRLMNDGYQVAR